MSKYDRQIAMAVRQIKAKGQAVVWSKPASTIDPTKPWKQVAGAPATTDFNVSILFLKPKSGFLSELIKGTEATKGAPRGFMAADPKIVFTPEQNDTVNRNGVILQVKYFDVIAPDGTPIIYEIQFA